MISCQICGCKTHAVRKHLQDSHPEWTVERYEREFPEAPIFSAEALQRIEAAKIEREKALKAAQELPLTQPNLTVQMAGSNLAEQLQPQAAVQSAPMIRRAVPVRTEKRHFHEIFKLGDNKLAFGQATGKPIPVTVLDPTTVTEPDYIPTFDEGYIFNVELLKSLIVGIEMNVPTYLYGHAGLGKSTVWEQIAAATNRPMRRVQHTVNTEESHIVGQYVVNHVTDPATGELKAKTEFQLGDLPLAMMNGEIFLADEYDRAYPSVLSVYQAVLEGKALHIKEAPPHLRVIKPHPEFRFVATGNTNGAGDDTGLYQATVVQDAATFERFGIVERIDYMSATEEEGILRAKTKCSAKDAKRAVKFANEIRQNAFPKEVSLTIGPRVLLNIVNIGIRRGNLIKGAEVAYANRLPEAERRAAISLAERILAD